MNKSIWNLYKNSERGKKAIELFTFNSEKDNLEDKLIEIFLKFNRYLGGESVEDYFLSTCFLVINNLDFQEIYSEGNDTRIDYFEKIIDNLELNFLDFTSKGDLFLVENEKPLVAKKDYKTLCAIIPEISLILYLFEEFHFYPILFREQFDVCMRILDVLEIPIPDLPAKPDKRGRLLLYNNLNENIINFAKENNLTQPEACACLYDFASMLFDENEKEEEIPEPTNVWLTGGSKSDYTSFLENPIKGEKSVWTCNENTKRGDIIIMYVLSPYSCIQSIWRADIDGVYTPFNYYNSRTKVTDGITIPHISIKELKTDSYFSQLAITRKNFQGVNGVRFTATDYAELQRLLKEKGFDTSVLPQLYSPELEIQYDIKNEKDVEEKLLIPLLSKLGFNETDWIRQLSQKAGRKEKIIPDFVFLPKGEKHFQNAPLIIEAKFDFSSNIEKTKSYNQALSYARLMKSTIFGICDKNRLIIYKEEKGHFNRFKSTFEKHWQNINDPETFGRLKLLIGKDTFK